MTAGNEEAPSAGTLRASDNEFNYQEENVMSNATAIPKENNVQATTAKIIPFRQKELLLVDNAGAPFVPMKPVVEGMGLAWQAQHRKLMAGRFASTITMMVIVAEDGRRREMACIPLRKLAGWLMSIHASKVRPELREGVMAYQNECDDALWSYWNDGAAVRPHGNDALTIIGSVIGTSGVNVLDRVIDQKASPVLAGLQRSFKHTMKSRLRSRFNVQRTDLIPADALADACNFVAAYALEGEWLSKEQPMQAAMALDENSATNLRALCSHAEWLLRNWNATLAPALRQVRSPLEADFHEHFVSAGLLARAFAEPLKLELRRAG